MIDLSKLAPAPWSVEAGEGLVDGNGLPLLQADDDVWLLTLEASALARNALDVMMRRGWEPRRYECPMGGNPSWQAYWSDGRCVDATNLWPNPFTALVEADKWFRENVEKEQTNA